VERKLQIVLFIEVQVEAWTSNHSVIAIELAVVLFVADVGLTINSNSVAMPVPYWSLLVVILPLTHLYVLFLTFHKLPVPASGILSPYQLQDQTWLLQQNCVRRII
jgi:hypothetical protein